MSEELNSVKLLLEEVKKQLDRIENPDPMSNIEIFHIKIFLDKCNNCHKYHRDRILVALKNNDKKFVEGYIHCLYLNDNINTKEFNNLIGAL